MVYVVFNKGGGVENYLVVYAHPNPKSFNHAIKEEIVSVLKSKGKEVQVRDLYQLGVDPVLSASDFSRFSEGKVPADIETEQEFIRKAEAVIFVHPVWWFGVPAILKGYIDRVFSKGFAYDFAGRRIIGLLKDKKVMVFSTTGGPRIAYYLLGYKKAIKSVIDTGIFRFCGMKVLFHKFFYGVPTAADARRKRMLESIKRLLDV